MSWTRVSSLVDVHHQSYPIHVDHRGSLRVAHPVPPDIVKHDHGSSTTIVPFDSRQLLVVRTLQRGTIRGLHYQREPYSQAKLVQVLRGEIFDVVVDLRPTSPTFRCWSAYEIVDTTSAPAQITCLYVPRGCAHGYQALHDDTLVMYHVDNDYMPTHEAGLRWNDPSLGIEWALPVTEIHPRDAEWTLIEHRNLS